MNQIIIERKADGWYATYRGIHRKDILDMFGTDTIPTAFAASADEGKVLEKIRQLNPGTLVTPASSWTA